MVMEQSAISGQVSQSIVALPSSGQHGMPSAIACISPATASCALATAGVPNGTLAPLDLSQVYLHNAQFTGTSGSRLEDQALTLRKALDGRLSPNQSVAAVGGMEAAHDGLRDMMSGRFPGKIVIFPQITGLPLTGLDEIKSVVPELADCLGPGDTWTPKAEAILIERFWKP